MKANTVARHYGLLTPEERFALIAAAGARGDEAEQERLANSGRPIQLTMSDHAPFSFAFNELCLVMFIEALETAAGYMEMFRLAGDAEAEAASADESEGRPEDDQAEDVEAESVSDVPAGEEDTEAVRLYDLALVQGFMLRLKIDGWKLFCERVGVSPFATWTMLPGFERLERALKLTEVAAFRPEGMLRYLNDLRPEGEPDVPKLTALPLTAEATAAGLERCFRQQVERWGGE